MIQCDSCEFADTCQDYVEGCSCSGKYSSAKGIHCDICPFTDSCDYYRPGGDCVDPELSF